MTRPNPFIERSGLLSEYDLEDIEAKAWGTDPFALPDEGGLIPALTELAYGMQVGVGQDGGLVSLPRREVTRLLKVDKPSDVIRLGRQLNILTEEAGQKGRNIRFAHQLIQEYFAARRLAQTPEPERVEVEHRAAQLSPTYLEEITGLEDGVPVSALPTTGWEEETMILAAGMVDDPEQLIGDLMPLNLPLAGRCALSAEVTLSPSLQKELVQALLTRLSDTAYDVRGRLQAALVLGELGDPPLYRPW